MLATADVHEEQGASLPGRGGGEMTDHKPAGISKHAAEKLLRNNNRFKRCIPNAATLTKQGMSYKPTRVLLSD